MLKSKSKIKTLALLLSFTLVCSIFSSIYFELKYNRNFPFFARPLEFFIQHLSTLVFLIGLCQLFVSQFRKSVVLKIYLQYYIITVILLIPFKTYWTFFSPNKPVEITTILLTALNYAIFFFKAYVLYVLEKKSTPLLEAEEDGNVVFRPVNRWYRLLHRLIDVPIYFLAIYSTSSVYRYLLLNTDVFHNSFLSSIIRESNTATGAYTITSFFVIFYYLILEVIFNTTIGKTILGNIIVNDEGARPSFGQRLGRTFCRLIPFDALSFLFSQRGWHDSITNTYVVKAEPFSNSTNSKQEER